MNKSTSIIRTIYLYLFALVGLMLIVIGSVDFINMGLKVWVFTQAEQEERMWDEPPRPYFIEEKIISNEESLANLELTIEEKNSLQNWQADYTDWKERRSKIDYVTARRHRDAARNLAMMIVGLPLYLYHWTVIKKDVKKRKEDE